MLHLLPGIIVVIAYLILLKANVLSEYPNILIFALAGIPGILIMELGILFYFAKKETGTFDIMKILGLKSKLKAKKFILLTVSLFLIAGIAISLCRPISNFLFDNVFGFMSNEFNLMQDMSIFNKNIIIATIMVNFFIFTILYPIIEEFYFRGFLLCRMEWIGKYAVLLNTLLFAIYHFWSPCMIVTRTVAFLPLFYVVYKKKSLKLSITVHCLANLTDVIALIPFLL